MRRVWFKKEMKEAILKGEKTATSRPHPLPLEKVQAVSGSRYKAKVFAILDIWERVATKPSHVIGHLYREEGFSSPENMVDFMFKENLHWDEREPLYFHRFKLVDVTS